MSYAYYFDSSILYHMLSTPSYKDYIFSWSCKLCYILLYFGNNNLYSMHTKFWVSVLVVTAATPTYPRHWLAVRPSHGLMGRPSKQGLVRTCVSVTPRSIGVSAGPVAIGPQRIRSDPTAPPALFAAAGNCPYPCRCRDSCSYHWTTHAREGPSASARRWQQPARSRPGHRGSGAIGRPPVLSLGLVTNRCEYFLEKETEMQVGPSYSTPADTDSNAS